MAENIYEILAAYSEIRRPQMFPLSMMDPENCTRFPAGLICRRVEWHRRTRTSAPVPGVAKTRNPL